MKALNARQREAIESLQRHGAQWALLVQWLELNRDAALSECARADDEVHVRRTQGQVRCLDGLLGVLAPRV